MKVLNIKSDGTINLIIPEGEVCSDISDERLSAADAQLIQDEIETMQAQNFQELHLEKGPIQTFVHKIGNGNFVTEDNPDAYNVFVVMDQWGPNLVTRTV